jgi:hypothetical protein
MAEILCGILRKIIAGLDRKDFFKNAQKVDFQFYAQKYPFLGRLKWP